MLPNGVEAPLLETTPEIPTRVRPASDQLSAAVALRADALATPGEVPGLDGLEDLVEPGRGELRTGRRDQPVEDLLCLGHQLT